MATKRKSGIENIIELSLSNPFLAQSLKENPVTVAKVFGVSLTESEGKLISEKLDVKEIIKKVKELDSFAQKVAQGVGIKHKS